MQQLSPREWILVDIANNYGGGLDKLTWDSRIEWATKHELELESLSCEASTKLLYDKAVRSLRLVDNHEPTNISVSLDATTSFLEIMAVLMRCSKSAEASNLIYTGKRRDFYTDVTKSMNTQLAKEHALSISRELIKEVVMIFFYGGSAKAREVFENNPKHLKLLYRTLTKLVPGAHKCRNLCIDTWDSTATEHVWTKDDDTYVQCPVLVKKSKRITCGTESFIHRASVIGKDKLGVSNAANFIQSIDAMIMSRMIKQAHIQGFELYGIHDSFWCSGKHMNKVRQNYLDILIDIAGKPIFVSWLNTMRKTNGLTDMNEASIKHFIEQIRTAEYHLS